MVRVKPLIPRSKKLSSTAARWRREFHHDNLGLAQIELNLYGVWAYDALMAFAMEAERVGFREPSPLQKRASVFNSSNIFTTELSQTDPQLLEAILDATFEGLGGKFHLINGQLESSYFQILNVVGKGEREIRIWTPQGWLDCPLQPASPNLVNWKKILRLMLLK